LTGGAAVTASASVDHQATRSFPRSAGAVVAALATVAIAAPNLWADLRPFDGGIAASAATFTLHGQLPYRDYWLLYGPLSGFVLAAPTALLGPSIVLLRVAGLGVVFGQAAIGYLIVRQWAGHFAALLIAVAATCIGPLFFRLEFQAWSLAMLFALASMYLRIVRPTSSFHVGMMLGVTFLIRLDVGAYALLAGLFAPHRRHLLAGFVITSLPVAVFFLAVTPLDRLLEQLVWYPLLGQRPHRSLPGPETYMDPTVARVIGLPLSVLPRLLVGAGIVRLIARSPRPRWLLVLTTFATLCQLQTLTRPDFFHLSQAATPGILLAGYWVSGRLDRARFGLLAGVSAACVSVAMLGLAWLAIAPSDYDAELRKAAAIVRAQASPSEPIFVGLVGNRYTSLNPLIVYYLADRRPASRYTMYNPGITNTEAVQNQMIQELESSGVRFLVLDRKFAETTEGGPAPEVAPLDVYIEARFTTTCDLGQVVIATRRDGQGVDPAVCNST
jgi:hypothetical protein